MLVKWVKSKKEYYIAIFLTKLSGLSVHIQIWGLFRGQRIQGSLPRVGRDEPKSGR